ncbi:flagellar hook-length control protein FliK [Lachnoclostridium sp.]|uniref:flagellar hook-length control protein FliK n=1 Tax=Lachnoclostridium sp. TaxID=2028282 RepID=UPI0028A295D3|nr:flagellar hook-length control protein FliK [Lachnoclostridium sp.]
MEYQTITSPSFSGVSQSTTLTATKVPIEETDGKVSSTTVDNLNSIIPAQKISYDSNHMIEKALTEAALPKTERNLNIVRELLRQELSIDKNSILDLLKLSATFRNASIETLVLMKKLELPITQQSINQMQAFQNNNHSILMQSQNMIDSFLTLLSEESVISEGFHHELLSLFINDTVESSIPDYSLLSTHFSREEIQQLTHTLTATDIPEYVENRLTDPSITVSEFRDFMNQSAKDSNLNFINVPQLQQFLTKTPEAASNFTLITDVLSKSEQENLSPLLSSVLPKDNLALFQESNGSITNLDGSITNLFQKIINAETTTSLQSEEAQFTSVLQPNDMPSALSALIKSPTYQKLIKSELLSKLSLEINDFTKKDGLPQFYRKLTRDLESMLTFFDKNEGNTNPETFHQAKEQVQNLRDQVDFMKSINQFLGYIQLPVKLTKDLTNSELFFYTKRKQKRENEENLHILLHLSMTHLGEMDIHLRLKNRTVHATLSMEQEESLALIDTHINQLTDALLEMGYDLSYDFEKMEKKQTPIDRLLLKEEEVILSRCYTFDTRA